MSFLPDCTIFNLGDLNQLSEIIEIYYTYACQIKFLIIAYCTVDRNYCTILVMHQYAHIVQNIILNNILGNMSILSDNNFSIYFSQLHLLSE